MSIDKTHELRGDFKNETGKKLWAEYHDNDCGFSEQYVFWLEQKILKNQL